MSPSDPSGSRPCGYRHPQQAKNAVILAGLLTAHGKGVRLGIFEPSPEHVAQHRQSLKHGDMTEIRLMGRNVEAIDSATFFAC